MNNELTVCIIDDDEAIRESLRLLLFAAGIRSRSFESAMTFLDAGDQPDVACILLDIRMPGMDGLELFQELNQRKSPCPVIFITGHGDIPLAISAIRQGAFDFLTKPFRDGELLDRVQAALAHFQDVRRQIHSMRKLSDRAAVCTPRELDVMRLMVRGLPNKGIAEALSISPRTVEIHRAHVMEKMQAESLPDLVRMAALLEAFEAGD